MLDLVGGDLHGTSVRLLIDPPSKLTLKPSHIHVLTLFLSRLPQECGGLVFFRTPVFVRTYSGQAGVDGLGY